ncbi:glycosyltransferase [Micrococcus luteus]|nr:glycosyltransferase [Micrococcus luteus]
MSAASEGRPVVSVIVPAFNAERVLGLQLDSLADQGGAPAYEVLVVDNNSTDGTADLVRDRTSAFPVPLRLIRAAEHRGLDTHGTSASLARERTCSCSLTRTTWSPVGGCATGRGPSSRPISGPAGPCS